MSIFYLIAHNILHLLLPLSASLRLYRSKLMYSWLTMVSAYMIDLDHFFSSPVFDPDRCSIGNHLLHSYPAIAVYIVLLYHRKTRLAGIGLLIHIFTDLTECLRIFFTS